MVEKKNRLCTTLGEQAQGAFNINNTSKNWDNFLMAFDNFDDTIKKQTKDLKHEILKSAKIVSTDIDKFYQRWEKSKP